MTTLRFSTERHDVRRIQVVHAERRSAAPGLDPTHAEPDLHLGARAAVRLVLLLRQPGRLGEDRAERKPERRPPAAVAGRSARDIGQRTVGDIARRLRGPRHDGADRRDGGGISYADLYHLGSTDAAESHGEEDIVAVGARSFTGATIDGTPEGLPSGVDEFFGISWLDFLTDDNTPDEPVEIGVQTWGVHNVTESLEVDVLIDAGADGVFADPELQADYWP